MTAYRRNFVPGGCFFTVNLAERKLSLLTDHVELLRAAFRETLQRHPFTIDAIVVLPDHLHTVWTLPEGDADFATRWQLIKSTFSRCLARNEPISRSRSAKGERGIWQRPRLRRAMIAKRCVSQGLNPSYELACPAATPSRLRARQAGNRSARTYV